MSTWKAQKIWFSEDEMMMLIGILVYYIFSVQKTFTSILSLASGWGHFSGVSGKLSLGWSGELRGHKVQEEGPGKAKHGASLRIPDYAASRHTSGPRLSADVSATRLLVSILD